MQQPPPRKSSSNVPNILGVVVFAIGLIIYLRMHPPGQDVQTDASTWRPPADFRLNLSDAWMARQPEQMLRLNGLVTYQDDHAEMIFVSRYPRVAGDTAASVARADLQSDVQVGDKARIQTLTVCGQPGRLVHAVLKGTNGQVSDMVIVADQRLIYEFDLHTNVGDSDPEIAPALHAMENVCFADHPGPA